MSFFISYFLSENERSAKLAICLKSIIASIFHPLNVSATIGRRTILGWILFAYLLFFSLSLISITFPTDLKACFLNFLIIIIKLLYQKKQICSLESIMQHDIVYMIIMFSFFWCEHIFCLSSVISVSVNVFLIVSFGFVVRTIQRIVAKDAKFIFTLVDATCSIEYKFNSCIKF